MTKKSKGVMFRWFKTKPDGSVKVIDFGLNGVSGYTWRKPENNWQGNKLIKKPKKKKVKFIFMSGRKKVGEWGW